MMGTIAQQVEQLFRLLVPAMHNYISCAHLHELLQGHSGVFEYKL